MFSLSRIGQAIQHLPRAAFDKIVVQHKGDRYVKRFSAWDHQRLVQPALEFVVVARERMTMNSNLRRFALTVHITSSVGLLGSIAAFLTLAIASPLSMESTKVRPDTSFKRTA